MYNGVNYGSLVLIFTEPNLKINVASMDTSLFTQINQVTLTASTFKKLNTKIFLWTYQSTEFYPNQRNDVQNVSKNILGHQLIRIQLYWFLQIWGLFYVLLGDIICWFLNLRFVSPCIIVTIQINHQPDATFFQFIILTFIYSSKCFGGFSAHHQELNVCSSSLWFYLRIVVITVLCSW
jgi:hypothetical protein